MPPRIALASRLPDEYDPTAIAAGRLADETGGELVLVYVAVELATVQQLHAATGENVKTLRERMIMENRRQVGEYLRRNLPGREVSTWILEGAVVDAIANFVKDESIDYLVIGTEGRSKLSQVVLGSTSHDLLREAPCPVLVVPASPPLA